MEKKRIGMVKTLFALLFLMGSLAYTIVVVDGYVHVPLVLSAAVVSVIAMQSGVKWEEIERGIVEIIARTLPAVLFIFMIGMIIGVWIEAGIVPTLVFWGLKLISPKFFLVSALFSCSIVSIATGSSWTVIATIGIALLGVGNGLGIPPAITAGAIISGSYFGDKMSPLSETTNLAPAVTGATLFEHIRHMVYTTGVSYVIVTVLYFIIGSRYSVDQVDVEGLNTMLTTIQATFNVNLLLLLCPLIVIVLVVKKFPPIPSLFSGVLIGGLFAIIFQGSTLVDLFNVAYSGFSADTGVAFVDKLLSKGGISSMYYTIGMILSAMMLGGALDQSGMLSEIAEVLLKRAKSQGSLVLATVATCIGVNLVASDQYLAIVLPGRMYKDEFERRGLHAKNLSRILEDSGTLTSVLIPWNTCGAYVSGVIGIHPFAYAPYAFLNLLNPLVSIAYGYLGITMEKVNPEADDNLAKE